MQYFGTWSLSPPSVERGIEQPSVVSLAFYTPKRRISSFEGVRQLAVGVRTLPASTEKYSFEILDLDIIQYFHMDCKQYISIVHHTKKLTN